MDRWRFRSTRPKGWSGSLCLKYSSDPIPSQTTKQNISLHIQNLYEEGELAPESTVKKYLTVRREGSRTVKRLLDYYNLDMIISVGYRVKSSVATRFRQWATAKARYLDDLRASARTLEAEKKKLAKPKSGKAGKRKKRDGG